MKIKTSELIGAALDWAVAKCEGALSPLGNVIVKGRADRSHKLIITVGEIEDPIVEYSPSTDWAQGGHLLEEELMQVFNYAKSSPNEPWFVEKNHFGRHHKAGRSYASGPTILIAVMRCFVASRLGDEVDVPEELT